MASHSKRCPPTPKHYRPVIQRETDQQLHEAVKENKTLHNINQSLLSEVNKQAVTITFKSQRIKQEIAANSDKTCHIIRSRTKMALLQSHIGEVQNENVKLRKKLERKDVIMKQLVENNAVLRYNNTRVMEESNNIKEVITIQQQQIADLIQDVAEANQSSVVQPSSDQVPP
jgi:hypothetical protein